MYRGAWAQDAVSTISASGGKMTAADLATYSPALSSPRFIDYHGYDEYAGCKRVWAEIGLRGVASRLKSSQCGA